MKKIVFCLVALSLSLPMTSFAEDNSSTPESSTVESSLAEDSSTLETTKNSEAQSIESSSATIESTSSETKDSSSTISALGDTSLLVHQGDTVTAEMLLNNAHYHGAEFPELKLLETPSTTNLGKNSVKVSYKKFSFEEDKLADEETIITMSYTVIKADSTYDIQFISYDSEKTVIKGRVIAIDGSNVSNISIYGQRSGMIDTSIPTNVIEFFPYTAGGGSATTDGEGYFTLPYQDNYKFFAFTIATGDYSPVYTLDKEAIAGAKTSTDGSSVAKNTTSSEPKNKKEEKKKGLFPNTGEKKTVYFSIAGIAIILLAVLFLFIKSKKNKK